MKLEDLTNYPARTSRLKANGHRSAADPAWPHDPPFPYDTFLITYRVCPAGTDPDAPLDTLRAQCAIKGGELFDITFQGWDRMTSGYTDPNGRLMINNVERFSRDGTHWHINHTAEQPLGTKPTVYGRYYDPPADAGLHDFWEQYTVNRHYYVRDDDPVDFTRVSSDSPHNWAEDHVILESLEFEEPVTFACEWFHVPPRDANANPPPSRDRDDASDGS